jgi:hypothetical protein
MLAALTLPPMPTLRGERVIAREPRDSDADDRLRHPIDPEEEDGYGSSWRREWDGRRYHTRHCGQGGGRVDRDEFTTFYAASFPGWWASCTP